MAKHDTMHIKIPESQYVVSLDRLDLSLLGHYVEKPDQERRLLWSTRTMDGESEYYHVVIAENDEHSEACLESLETYICHVCNIDVPKIYYRQHTKSKKHQCFKKLAETFLENVSKQINVEIESTNNNVDINFFYCEPCSKVIAVKNKLIHNTSDYHLKSIENQKLTDKFIEIYTESVNAETVTENKEEKNISDNNIVSQAVNKTDSVYNSISDSDWTDADSETENNVIPINKIVSDTTISATYNMTSESNNFSNMVPVQITTINKGTDFLLHLKQMVAKYKLNYKLPIVENDQIIVTTPKGHQEKISIDVFHGLKKVRDATLCQICKKWINEDEKLHLDTENHIRGVTQPFDDNFCRELITNKLWCHCLLCNTITLIADNHADFNPNHRKYNQLRFKQTFCKACNVFIDTHNFLGHTKSKKHIAKSNNVVSETNITKPQIANNDRQYCVLCQVHVPGGGMTIHEKGKNHQRKLAGEIQAAILENFPSTSTAPVAIQQNTYDLPSIEKINEYMKQMAEVSGTEVECLVCKVNVPNLDSNIIQHVEGTRHKNAVDDLLNENRTVKITAKLYYCAFCSIQFDDFVDHFDENVQHIKWKLSSEENIDKKQLVEYVHKDPENGSALAIAYRELYSDLLKKNRIYKVTDLFFLCFACDISNLTRISEIDHMFGERHKSALEPDN